MNKEVQNPQLNIPTVSGSYREQAMQWAKDKIKCDADIRSMCSAGFAEAFFQNNR